MGEPKQIGLKVTGNTALSYNQPTSHSYNPPTLPCKPKQQYNVIPIPTHTPFWTHAQVDSASILSQRGLSQTGAFAAEWLQQS